MDLNILKPMDRFLNSITMYRLTLYILIVLMISAFAGSLFGLLPYRPLDILISSVIAVTFCYLTNFIFAKIFRVFPNVESVFITALILVLIIPVKFPQNVVFFIVASILAMASKYLLNIKKRHIFNPAAIAIVVFSLIFPGQIASWWVGNLFMFPIIIIGAFLLIRKTRREYMAYSFLAVYILIVSITSFFNSLEFSSVIYALRQSFFESALLFFGSIMLTEPQTSPATKKLQIRYAVFVAFLYTTPQLRLLGIELTPEMALCFGNIYSYFISPNYRLGFILKEKTKLSHDTFAFIFSPVKNFKFIPGQYLEWTLQHKNTDTRGNRRYFSLASSPTEEKLMIAVKFYDKSSSYKKALVSLPIGSKIMASNLAGDFVMLKDLKKPLVFIAGGVGITPFRSVTKYIIDNKLNVNIILVFINKTFDDILYKDILKEAGMFGIKTIHVLTDESRLPPDFEGLHGHLTDKMVKEIIPDFPSRIFYISGPQLMVQNIEKTLLDMKISKPKIKTDFFPGYVD